MLFHITGPSGSGKTTLGHKLSKINFPNTKIIDTDEIDDQNAMEIIENSEFKDFFTNENTMKKFWKMLDQKNIETISKLFEEYKDSNIIIVGMTIFPPEETNVQGYSIDISPDIYFHQLNKRTLKSICTNCEAIKDLLDKSENQFISDLIMLFKYKLRNGFPITPLEIGVSIEIRKKQAHDLGYKYLSQEKIVEDINKTLSKSDINSSKQ